jgi:hypothetical protein
MKIQSQFKDYYDHVAHLYGGGDPKVLYLRNRLGKMERWSTDSYVRGLDIEQKGLPTAHDDEIYRKFNHRCKWLAINGKLYLILTKESKMYEAPVPENWTVLDETRHPDIWEYLHTSRSRWQRDRDEAQYIGREVPAVLELSRKVGAPVFTFESSYRHQTAKVDGNVPILATMGIPALIPAEQLYQDIAYFLGNTMKGSPDMMPPTVQTDKEKIAAAGFDLKASFRHRT